jgi:hypothetical protein
MGNYIGSKNPDIKTKIIEREKICNKFDSCNKDKLYNDLSNALRTNRVSTNKGKKKKRGGKTRGKTRGKRSKKTRPRSRKI